METARKVQSWMVYSAVCLGRARFASVANLLLGGAWTESLEDDLAVAYDFLCDLYLETGRDDVQRPAEFLGRCQSLGVAAAVALETEELDSARSLQDRVEFEDDISYAFVP